MKKILLSLALLGSICQESSAITADQVAGACELFTAAAGACSVYVLCQNSQETVNKNWADFLRTSLADRGVTTISYEGNMVDIATLTDEQILAVTGKDKMLRYYPLVKGAFLVFCSTATVYFAAKAIGRFNK